MQRYADIARQRYHAGDELSCPRDVRLMINAQRRIVAHRCALIINRTAHSWRVLIAGMIALSRDVRVRGALIVKQTARGWPVSA